jgi:prefoldin subunit 5
MVTLLRRAPLTSLRGGVGVLVLTALLFGATGASVLFVGVWRNEASRARVADTELAEAAEAVSAASEQLRRTQARLTATTKELRGAKADVKRQSALLGKLSAAGKPIAADAGRLDAAAQQLAADGTALGDAVAKLTNAVAALGVYLKQTSPGQLDPAYLDAQLSYLQQALGSLQARSERLRNGAGAVATSRQALAGKTAELQRLAEGTR